MGRSKIAVFASKSSGSVQACTRRRWAYHRVCRKLCRTRSQEGSSSLPRASGNTEKAGPVLILIGDINVPRQRVVSSAVTKSSRTYVVYAIFSRLCLVPTCKVSFLCFSRKVLQDLVHLVACVLVEEVSELLLPLHAVIGERILEGREIRLDEVNDNLGLLVLSR
jgi:hypothetical protein